MSVKESLINFFIRREINKKENLDMIKKIVAAWNFIEGHKSTFFAILSGVAIAGNIFGFITEAQAKEILALSGTGYGASMALKVNRLIDAIKEAKQVVARQETNTTTVTVASASANPPEVK